MSKAWKDAPGLVDVPKYTLEGLPRRVVLEFVRLPLITDALCACLVGVTSVLLVLYFQQQKRLWPEGDAPWLRFAVGVCLVCTLIQLCLAATVPFALTYHGMRSIAECDYKERMAARVPRIFEQAIAQFFFGQRSWSLYDRPRWLGYMGAFFIISSNLFGLTACIYVLTLPEDNLLEDSFHLSHSPLSTVLSPLWLGTSFAIDTIIMLLFVAKLRRCRADLVSPNVSAALRALSLEALLFWSLPTICVGATLALRTILNTSLSFRIALDPLGSLYVIIMLVTLLRRDGRRTFITRPPDIVTPNLDVECNVAGGALCVLGSDISGGGGGDIGSSGISRGGDTDRLGPLSIPSLGAASASHLRVGAQSRQPSPGSFAATTSSTSLGLERRDVDIAQGAEVRLGEGEDGSGQLGQTTSSVGAPFPAPPPPPPPPPPPRRPSSGVDPVETLVRRSTTNLANADPVSGGVADEADIGARVRLPRRPATAVDVLPARMWPLTRDVSSPDLRVGKGDGATGGALHVVTRWT